MNYENFEYVILNEEKTPIHKFKHGGKKWDEVKDFDNIGVLIKEPYVVFDFDTVSDAQIALNIIRSTGLKCSVMKTTRGIHVWLKSPTGYKNRVKVKLPVGIYADIRSWGRAGYTKIKNQGAMREWLIENEELDEVPTYFEPLGLTGDRFKFNGMKSGDGRNGELYAYIVFLLSKGFAKDNIKQIITLINRYTFKEKLSDRELKTILRDEAFKPEEELEKAENTNSDKMKFDHAQMALELANDKDIVTVDDVIYMYKDGYYQPALNDLELELVSRKTDIKKYQRAEVIEYLKIITRVEREDIEKDIYSVNLINGRLDIRTGKLSDHTPAKIDFERLPIFFDKDAHSASVDELLSKVFVDDAECIELFYQILGDCILHKNVFQKAFLFVGEGSNGKSTILRMLRAFVGEKNSSTISLEELGGHFKTAELENKLLNLGDDIEDRPVRNSGLIKKLFSGESVVVEKKYGNPFVLNSYATQIFSCNAIPKNADRSNGMYRRWMIVPFDAVFVPGQDGFNPLIGDEVVTDQAKSYLLNLAIKGYKILSSRGYYKEPERVKAKKEQFKVENNSILQWIEDKDITSDVVVEEPRDAIYEHYRTWCINEYIAEPLGKNTFYKEIRKNFNLSDRFNRVDSKRYFVENIDL